MSSPILFSVCVVLTTYLLLQFAYLLFIEIVRAFNRGDPVRALTFGPVTAETCLILVHGFADTPEAWRREGEALAARGMRVQIPVLDHDATEREWMETVQHAVAEARLTARSVWMWGHSMGGAVIVAMGAPAVTGRVLWAPFFAPKLGRRWVHFLYCFHRVLFLWPHTLTFFPSQRNGKGEIKTAYRVRRVIPIRTFSAMLRMQQYAVDTSAHLPTFVLLSQRDRVVENQATRQALPAATFAFVANPLSGHALTNATDWRENLEASLDFMEQNQ
ncbi:MAG: alpha/beta fold hydrolase [Kiritimatiellia bacterium]